MRKQIIQAIKKVFDPEIPVDVYELGLIYDITILPANDVHVLMTLTSPACPSAEEIPDEIKQKILEIEEIGEVDVELTFVPPYTADMMSEEARLELGFM